MLVMYWTCGLKTFQSTCFVPVLENFPIGTSSGKSSYWYKFWKIIL